MSTPTGASICVNAHDLCHGGAGGPCPYCEPRPRVEYTGEGQAVVREPHVFVPYGRGELCDVCGQAHGHRLHGDDYTRRIAATTPNIIIRNARRLLKRRYAKSPNWVLAMEIFGLGSTYASRLCVDNGLDPDGVA